MNQIDFKWKTGELLTRQRLVEFTHFLHQHFGYLNTYNACDFGFDIPDNNAISYEIKNGSELAVLLPPMCMIFPDGYLMVLNKEQKISIKFEQAKLICLTIQQDNTENLMLRYCNSENEAYKNNYLPFLNFDANGNRVNYLKPVLKIFQAEEYNGITKSLDSGIDACIKRIENYFLNDAISKNTPSGILRNLVFQSWFTCLIEIKATIKKNKSLSSFSYFNLFASALIVCKSVTPFLNKIDELNQLSYITVRESRFFEDMEKLIDEIEFLYNNKNITLLQKWINSLVTVLDHFSTLNNEQISNTQNSGPGSQATDNLRPYETTKGSQPNNPPTTGRRGY